MVMKSIFTVFCFIIMALVIGTTQREIPPIKIINLKEEMNATCKNLMNGTCGRIRVNEVDFNVNCEQAAFRDTFCQINRALLRCKDYTATHYLSGFHANVKCTSKIRFIPLKVFCSKMLDHIDEFYGRCATIKNKGK